MKRITTLLLTALMLLCVSCTHSPVSDTEAPFETGIPITPGSVEDVANQITNYASMTGDITNYTVEVVRVINSSIRLSYKYQNNGNGLIRYEYAKHTSPIPGQIIVDSQDVYFDNRNALIYTLQNDMYHVSEGNTNISSLSSALNDVVGYRFFETLLNTLNTCHLRVNQFEYQLPSFHVSSGNETIFFDNATVILDSNYRIKSFACSDDTQTINIQISNINSTSLKLPENIFENSEENT